MAKTPSTTSYDEKHKLLDKLLGDEFVLIHVNTQVAGVQVPAHLKSSDTVTLKISRFFRKPVFLGKDTIRQELLFKGEYENCVVPWEALWGVTSASNEGSVWAAAIPPSVLNQLTSAAQEHAQKAPSSPPESPSEESKEAPSQEDPKLVTEPDGQDKKKVVPLAGRGHLRRVK